jgi:5-formyltetrahydrofolate cyclo-ligase
MTADGTDPEDVDDIRERGRTARRAVDPAGRAHAARQIATRVETLVATRRAGRAGTYLPTDGEIDPTFAVDSLRDAGWLWHLPVIGEDRSMHYAEWRTDSPLVTNRYGIEEPADATNMVAARDLDLVLLPCVAVDPAGNRLGFGAGYYDRALADAEDPQMRSSRPRPLLIGVVFDVQIVARIRRESWDVPLDAIVSESATIMTGARTWPMAR